MIKAFLGQKSYSNCVGLSSSGSNGLKTFRLNETEQTDGGYLLPEAGYHVSETDDNIQFISETWKLTLAEEYGSTYPIWEHVADKVLFDYNKGTKMVSMTVDLDTESKELTTKREYLSCFEIGNWLARVVYNENKYMYNIYCGDTIQFSGWAGYNMNLNLLRNTIKFINERTFGSLESIVKSLGIEFFRQNIIREEFCLQNAKKLHRVIELPKDVLEFLKLKEYAGLLPDFRILCADDPNEGIALVNWYNRYAKLQNLRNGIKMFTQFVSMLSTIKSTYGNKINLHRLLPYLAAQHFFYTSTVEEKFEIPYQELRTYRDYLNLGNVSDYYPSNLDAAHNIAVRNKKICSNEELCATFAEVVKPLKALEWTHDGFSIIAPTKAQDFVDEGEALHHCLATYVELVANGSERVMFVRNEATPDVSYVTFSFDSDYNVIEAKEAFNADVEDPKVLQLLSDWRKRVRAKEAEAKKKGA